MQKFFPLLIFVSVSVAKKVNGGMEVGENSENIRAYILSLRNYNPISATSQPSVTHPFTHHPQLLGPAAHLFQRLRTDSTT